MFTLHPTSFKFEISLFFAVFMYDHFDLHLCARGAPHVHCVNNKRTRSRNTTVGVSNLHFAAPKGLLTAFELILNPPSPLPPSLHFHAQDTVDGVIKMFKVPSHVQLHR